MSTWHHGSMEAGVTCAHCGGQTPLPEDLRVPTFTCRYCKQPLETVRYAGESVQVDHQMAFADEAMDGVFNFFSNPGVMPIANVMPDVVRPCRRCGQPVTMSLMFQDAAANCSHCGLSSTISDYLTEEQQSALRDEAYEKDAEALQAVRAHGVGCRTCGANNPAPPAATGQSICHHCGAVLLLSDYLPEHLVARVRRDERAMKGLKYAPRACLAALMALAFIALIIAVVIGALVFAVERIVSGQGYT